MRARELGVRLNVAGDRIQCRPASRLTPELRTAIKENKEHLIFDVLMQDAVHHLAEHYIEGADLEALSGPVHDEVCEAYGQKDLARFRAAIREYVKIGLVAFEECEKPSE
jgi:hypothetical protein